MKTKFERKCPSCGIVLSYASKSGMTFAENRNRLCRKCSKKSVDTIVDKKFERECPSCKTIVVYASKDSLVMVEKHNCVCNKCSGLKRRKPENEVWKEKDSAIKYLQSIAENGYVPGYSVMVKKFHLSFAKQVRQFGGYKELVKDAGLNIARYFKTSDGHIVSSYYEYLLDEYLYLNKIPHSVDGYIIDEKTKYRYDFKIDDVYIEIWGYSANADIFKHYNSKRKEKEKLYSTNNLKLISIEGKEFGKSSDELQIFFKECLEKHELVSSLNLKEYPQFATRKLNYWCENTILKELNEVIGNLNHFPTIKELGKIKKEDLNNAVRKAGGIRKFALMLGYKPKTTKYSEENVVNKLKEVKNKLGHFPLYKELEELGEFSLLGFIGRHGGFGYFQELVDGKRSRRPRGYWKDESNIVKEMHKLTNKLKKQLTYNDLDKGIIAAIKLTKKGIQYFRDKVAEIPQS